MWRAAHAWREHHVRTALAECGADDASSTEGWRWRQHADASLLQCTIIVCSMAWRHPTHRLICAQVGRAHAARQARPRARHGPAVGRRRRGRREPRAVLGARRARRGRRRARGPGRLPPDAAGRAPRCGRSRTLEDAPSCRRWRDHRARVLASRAAGREAHQASRAISRAEKRRSSTSGACACWRCLCRNQLRRRGRHRASASSARRWQDKSLLPGGHRSATLINAPAGVETLWRGVSVFLNAAMRAKVRIVGRDYREALTDHAKIDDYDLLPARLGGKAPDPPLPLPVPTGAGAGLERSSWTLANCCLKRRDAAPA